MRVAALIVALLLAVAFAIQNTAAVNVSLGFWKAQASLAIVMALCIALGFPERSAHGRTELFERTSPCAQFRAPLGKAGCQRLRAVSARQCVADE